MGAEAAITLGSPPAQDRDTRTSRSARFSAVGEVVGLYHDLERALAQTRDAELAQLAAAAREGEQALEVWAQRIEAFRSFKRRFEAGIHPADEPGRVRTPPAAAPSALTLDEPRRLSFVWEALAFVFGFVLSFLVA